MYPQKVALQGGRCLRRCWGCWSWPSRFAELWTHSYTMDRIVSFLPPKPLCNSGFRFSFRLTWRKICTSCCCHCWAGRQFVEDQEQLGWFFCWWWLFPDVEVFSVGLQSNFLWHILVRKWPHWRWSCCIWKALQRFKLAFCLAKA